MENTRDISFGTFNLRNLQIAAGGLRHGKLETEDNWIKKRDWTAQKLRELDCDVVAFQELWSRDALEAVLEEADLASTYRPYYVASHGWRDIAVAALVRSPWEVVDDPVVHKAMPHDFDLSITDDASQYSEYEKPDEAIEVTIEQFSRAVLQLRLKHQSAPEVPQIDVFCCHLKSKLPTRVTMDDQASMHETTVGAALATIRRTAEAAALRMIINTLLVNGNSPDSPTPIVVLGDLNDGLHSNTVSILTRQPSYRLALDAQTGRVSKWGLYTAGFLDQLRSFRDVNFSHDHKGVPEILDHVLVSDEFYDACKFRSWSFRDMTIWTDHINPFDPAAGTSDHGIVRTRFDWNPA